MALATIEKSAIVTSLEAAGIYVRACAVWTDEAVEVTSYGDAFKLYLPVSHRTELALLSSRPFAEVQDALVKALGGNVVVTRVTASAFSGGSDLTEFEFELSGRWMLEPSSDLCKPEPLAPIRTCSRAME